MASRYSALRGRIEMLEAKTASLLGGKESAVDKFARQLRAYNELKAILPVTGYWQPDEGLISSVAAAVDVTARDVSEAVRLHNNVLADFDENY